MTRSLSIAVACYPGLGGSGVIASELARALAAKGHRVTVLATEMPERLRVNGVRFEAIDVPTSPVFEHAPYGLAVANKLVELVRRTDGIDLVHLHYAVPHASSALLAARVLGAAAPSMIVTLHGTDVTRLGSHPSVHAVTAFALAACDGLTTPSRFLRDEAAERFDIAPDRIAVISNFVDLARFSPPPVRDRGPLAAMFAPGPDGPMLFHVSNFRPIKRTGDLAEVLVRVRESMPARMILVGDGPDHAAAVARAKELGVADHMCFLGRRDDFESLLGHADGFVLPSDSESFGVAALEAMACGVPVFGYRVGGVPDVVGDTGTLVPRGDTAGLAHAIVDGMPRAAELGHAARLRAESRFGSDRVVTAYEDYFRRVLASRTKEDSR